MPSLAKGKPTSSIKEATKVKEKESNQKDKLTGKSTRPTKAQLAREAQVEKDAKLDTILYKEWKFDPVKDRDQGLVVEVRSIVARMMIPRSGPTTMRVLT